jgi:hypothetical protein
VGESAASGCSRWWWDVTVWGIILLTALVHALLYEWTDEHTLAVVLMGSWVGFSLFQIRRGRSRRQHEMSAPRSADDAGQKTSSTEASGGNHKSRTMLGRLIALVLLAVMVVVILGTGSLTVPTAALGVWAGMEFALRQHRKDPIERRPPDPSLHDPTRRN